MKCKHCGRDFKPNTSWQIYCGRTCRTWKLTKQDLYRKEKINKVNDLILMEDSCTEEPIKYVIDKTQYPSNQLNAEVRPDTYLEREQFDDSRFKSMSKLDCLYCRLQKRCVSFMAFHGNKCPAFMKMSRKSLKKFYEE